ncbi:DUF2442 domain-containing protein [Bifidobacterium sp. ESL0775]|uniref:DUF2442 domain-containing protein n=1 Tax=Bifidobacterium sp. ESL0775 TaxID=2983230 RepID=UPI0023F77868|nr:DUF2442 domain-containing protein [Bifidobacterium sp. ESL0775]WEV68812.1 DUF2442 domain-containing protein [Bifidobacterium sp. ESL0775]
MFEKDGIVYADAPTAEMEIESVRVTDDHIMLVSFSTGETRICDFTKLFDKVPAFEPLRDEKVFKDVKVVHGIPTWQNDTIDISPTYLYDHSYECDAHGKIVSA